MTASPLPGPSFTGWMLYLTINQQCQGTKGNSQPMKSTTTTTILWPFFPGPPGSAGARRELLDFMVQGKINRGRRTDHPAGRHSISAKQCLPSPTPNQ